VKISAYIPCFNEGAFLPAAIAALRGQTLPPDEVLVIDNSSSDDTASVATALGARVIRHERDLGRGAARARAMQEARGEFVLALDASCTIEPEFVRTAVEILKREELDGVSARAVGPAPRTTVERWRARHLYKEEASGAVSPGLITGCCLLSRETVLAAGNFDARFTEGEDRELGERLLSRGHRVVLHPALRVTVHKRDTLCSVLTRYRRWNQPPGAAVEWRAYARLCAYAVKSMALADLRAGDPGSAAISLLCPHFQFWASRGLQRPSGQRAEMPAPALLKT
jgi:glycosyltransferase involved in cell wall biosynthesis